MTSSDLTRMNRVLRHRLRNSASGIKSSVTLLSEELKDVVSPDIMEYFPLIIKECDGLTDLTDRIHAFFDGFVPERIGFDGPREDGLTTEALATAFTDGLRRRFPGVAVTMRVEASAAQYAIPDAKRTVAAYSELATNAAEAAGRTFAVDGYMLLDDAVLRVGVSNGGALVDPDSITPMFSPFFTTKSRHIGIGLNLAQRFVAPCGGEVQAFAKPDGGMTVELRLPVPARCPRESR